MKKWILGIAVTAVLVAGFFFFQNNQAQAQIANQYQTQPVTRDTVTAIVGATGTVRSNQSAWLAWRTSGTVGKVDVVTGMQVNAGQVLATLEQTSLQQGIILAQTDLYNAEQALEELDNTDLQYARAFQAVEDAQETLDNLLNPELAQAEALEAIADAEKAVENAERNLAYTTSTATQADIDAQKAQVILAEDALEKAEEKYEPYENKPEDNLVRANLLAALSAAQQRYDSAVRTLNALESTGDPLDIAVAEAELATAQARLQESRRDYARIQDGPSEADIFLAETELEEARQDLEDLSGGPNVDEIASAEARVAAAQATLSQMNITAPFDGKITAVDALPGDQVLNGTRAFRLDDLSRLLVDVEVSEVDINQVAVGQTVALTFDAIIGVEYTGTVIDVREVGEVSQGVVNFLVTVELLDPDEQVKPGMTSAVSIITNKLENTLVVPSRAVRTVAGDLVIYLFRDGTPVAVEVTLGASSNGLSELLAGDVSEGDLVVLNPPTESILEEGPPQGGVFGG